MTIIGKIDPELKARIDRVQAERQSLENLNIPESYFLLIWSVLTRKLYELVEQI